MVALDTARFCGVRPISWQRAEQRGGQPVHVGLVPSYLCEAFERLVGVVLPAEKATVDKGLDSAAQRGEQRGDRERGDHGDDGRVRPPGHCPEQVLQHDHSAEIDQPQQHDDRDRAHEQGIGAGGQPPAFQHGDLGAGDGQEITAFTAAGDEHLIEILAQISEE